MGRGGTVWVVAIAACGLLLPGEGAAQEAEADTVVAEAVEPAPATDAEPEAPPPPPDRWGFEMNVSLTSTSGNEQITVFITDGKVSHLQTDAFKLELSGRLRYGRSQGEDVSQNMQGGLTLELAPGGRVSPFLFTQAEKDPFKRLDLRASSGAGVRYELLDGERVTAALSAAALHSYENLEVDPLATDPLRELHQTARWRWVANATASLLDGVEAEHQTYYEPVWDRAEDYLMEIENTLRFQINTHLTFRVAHLFERNSSPPEGIGENDYMLTVGAGFRTKF